MAFVRFAPLTILLLALFAHLLLWVAPSLVVQTAAALLLTGLLPGWLLVQWLVGRSAAPPTPGEALLYSIGAGYALITVLLLLLSYLPGPLSPWMLYVTFDGLLASLLWLEWRSQPIHQRGLPITPLPDLLPATWPAQPARSWGWIAAGLVSLLLVGGFFRFGGLGYADFHSDEARAVLRAAAVIQGHDEVLFLHKKGPSEILLPTLLFGLTDRLNEATARWPFALASLTALVTVWLLGWRLVGALAGWCAAFLLAFDGYLIAFAHFVQYQSIVLLSSLLAVLIAHRLWRAPQAVTRYLLLAALLLASGLLAHYDAAMTVVPLLIFLFALFWQRRVDWLHLVRGLAAGVLLVGGVVAAFYLPYILHPRFQATYAYLVDERLVAGRRFPYNNLPDIIQRSLVYDSALYLALLTGLTILALFVAYGRGLASKVGWLLGGVASSLLLITLWRTGWLHLGGVDLAVLPFTLALAAIWFTPHLGFEERMLWLWFGLLCLVALFFTAFARTHIYIFFAPWAILAGRVAAYGWRQLKQHAGRGMAITLGLLLALGATLLLGEHAYAYYLYHQEELILINRPAIWQGAQEADEVDSLYGFPFNNGWRVVGALYAQGVLQGDYETNQRYAWIPAWYTRGQPRCASTATWYFAVETIEPWALGRQQAEGLAEQQGFQKWGEILSSHPSRPVTKMSIYQRTPNNEAVQSVRYFTVQDSDLTFDHLADATLPLDYPVTEEKLAQPLQINFDNQLWLQGYQLKQPTPLKPGGRFRLKLYWQAQQRIGKSYKVSTQAYYGNGNMVAHKDSFPVCDREPTNSWAPGVVITDIHDLTVAADAPPGLYPLYTSLYLEETFARLPVRDATGAELGQQVQVGELRVEAP
jgi:hypothetical protein